VPEIITAKNEPSIAGLLCFRKASDGHFLPLDAGAWIVDDRYWVCARIQPSPANRSSFCIFENGAKGALIECLERLAETASIQAVPQVHDAVRTLLANLYTMREYGRFDKADKRGDGSDHDSNRDWRPRALSIC